MRSKAKPGQRRTPVVRDRVVKSPDVRPIERKQGPRSAAPSNRGGAPEKKSKAPLVIGLVVGLLAAAGAAAYFTGMLDSFLK